MSDERSWAAALEEHESALREFLTVCERIPADRWYEPPAPEKWSPADVVIHVCQAYELGRDSAAGGPGMRLRVSEKRAWVLRTLVFPVVLYTKRLPRGVRAPKEMMPDPATARRLVPSAATTRLKRVAQQAVTALRRAEDAHPIPRMTHAYFGALAPLAALRLLSAHTVHHARGLARLTGSEQHPGG
jgi:hypothetical protein